MSERDGEAEPLVRGQPEDAELSERLRDLDRRLDERRAAREADVRPAAGAAAPGLWRWRCGSAPISSPASSSARRSGGGSIALFGTSPWGLIVFLLLGFAAGILKRAAVRRAGEAGTGRRRIDTDGMKGSDLATDPIHQFQIQKIIPIEIGGVDLSFTNSSLFMVLTVAGAAAFLLLSTRRRAVVPGRWQSAAEMTYEFVAKTLRDSAGNEGMRFFPFVFSLFMFILVANLWGMFPYFFTVTSHIIVTAALAIAVILTVIVYGLWKHKLHFFKLFVPSGVPKVLLPFITLIEVLSFISRPISLSIRLFANMLAGHITLKVFAGFVVAARLGRRSSASSAPSCRSPRPSR